MRYLTALLLSLLLAVTSVTMAVARVAEPMGPAMTLCAEEGAVEVVLDAFGNPVPPHLHLCPDCLAGHVAMDLPVALPALAPAPDRARRMALPAPTQASGQPTPRATARGPPALFG